MAGPATTGNSSSINLGLQQVPDLTDIQSIGKLSFQFIQLYNAMNILANSIDAYTGNTPNPANTNGSTPESSVIVGQQANMWCNAQVNISAGFLVTLTNVGGVTNAKLALGSLGLVGMAHGLSMTTATAGSPVQVMLIGLFNFGGGVTPGALYYVSPSVGGGIVTLRPSSPGQLIQGVGFGVDTNSLFINPCLTPTLFATAGTGTLT